VPVSSESGLDECLRKYGVLSLHFKVYFGRVLRGRLGGCTARSVCEEQTTDCGVVEGCL